MASKRLRSSFERYSITIEWNTTVATPLTCSASCRSIQSAAPASAAPVEQLVPSTVNGEPAGQSQPVRVVQVDADNGFDWADAGIGASGLLALAAIVSGALVAIRHRPDTRNKVA